MTTPVFMPRPHPVVAPVRPYPNPIMQTIVARRPLGVGGVPDALGSAIYVLEVVGTIAVVLVGADILLKWAGHPLHHGRR